MRRCQPPAPPSLPRGRLRPCPRRVLGDALVDTCHESARTIITVRKGEMRREGRHPKKTEGIGEMLRREPRRIAAAGEGRNQPALGSTTLCPCEPISRGARTSLSPTP